jgi:hypothetical protein
MAWNLNFLPAFKDHYGRLVPQESAAKRKFDCVLFWALDRFSREGMAQTVHESAMG